MNWFQISASHLNEKKLSSSLSVVLMSFGVGIILILLILNNRIQESFENNIRGVDMVVGAKGSPLQIILSSVYHMDAPTGNINTKDAKKIASNRLVDVAIPLAFGDSYKGFKILGTTEEYARNFDAELEQGQEIKRPSDVILGKNTASILGLNIGDQFVGNHGLGEESIEKHEHHPYTVVGIYKGNNSVLDNLIITSVNSVWDVHSHGEHHHHTHEKLVTKVSDLDEEQDITSLLLKFKNPMANFSLPRIINQETNLQAALPSIEINRLIGLLGIGINTLQAIAVLIMFLSGASVFISLLANLKDKKYELALLRSFGASRLKLFQVILQEGLMLTLTGFVTGVIICRVALWVIGQETGQNILLGFNFITPTIFDLYLLIISVGIGIVSALIPALRAYRLNISETLSHD